MAAGGTVLCLVFSIKKFILVIFRTRLKGATSVQVKSFPLVTLTAVCHLGLVILVTDAAKGGKELEVKKLC